MNKHSTRTNNHRPITWVFDDSTARASATNYLTGTAYVTTDLYKFCIQLDTHIFYYLSATTPTWVQVGGSGSTSSTPRPYGFTCQGALTTSSYIWIPISYAMTLSTIHFEVTTAVGTSDMNIEVTYGTDPASMTTLYASSKPKIANGAKNSTGTEGTLTTTSLAQLGYIKITLSGTFTAATDLTAWMLPTV